VTAVPPATELEDSVTLDSVTTVGVVVAVVSEHPGAMRQARNAAPAARGAITRNGLRCTTPIVSSKTRPAHGETLTKP
jgi:hypothetical protein